MAYYCTTTSHQNPHTPMRLSAPCRRPRHSNNNKNRHLDFFLFLQRVSVASQWTLTLHLDVGVYLQGPRRAAAIAVGYIAIIGANVVLIQVNSTSWQGIRSEPIFVRSLL